MKTFLQHLRTGKLAPHDGSLFASAPWLWITLLQLCCVAIFAIQGWSLIQGNASFGWGELQGEDGLQQSLVEYLELGLGYCLLGGSVVTLMLRVPYFAVLRWIFFILYLISLSLVLHPVIQSGSDGLLEFVGTICLPLMFLWVLSFPRALKQLGWVCCGLFAAALCIKGLGLMELSATRDSWVSAHRALGFVILNLGVALMIPCFRRIALYSILGLFGMHCVLLFRDDTLSMTGVQLVNLTSQGVLTLLLLTLLQSWSPSNRLTLSMLEISSQTRRILSKATILHHK